MASSRPAEVRRSRRVRSGGTDELDRRIIALLQLDGRASNAKIARGVGVSEGPSADGCIDYSVTM